MGTTDIRSQAANSTANWVIAVIAVEWYLDRERMQRSRATPPAPFARAE